MLDALAPWLCPVESTGTAPDAFFSRTEHTKNDGLHLHIPHCCSQLGGRRKVQSKDEVNRKGAPPAKVTNDVEKWLGAASIGRAWLSCGQ